MPVYEYHFTQQILLTNDSSHKAKAINFTITYSITVKPAHIPYIRRYIGNCDYLLWSIRLLSVNFPVAICRSQTNAPYIVVAIKRTRGNRLLWFESGCLFTEGDPM